MFRSLMLFPTDLDHGEVVRLATEELGPAFGKSEGFRALAASIGPLMGPAAHEGEIGTIVEADFETLDAALAAITAESFAATRTKVESLGVRLYLFEFREL